MISYLFYFTANLCYDLLDLDLGVEFLEGNDLADVGEIILEGWILASISLPWKCGTVISLSGPVVYMLVHFQSAG